MENLEGLQGESCKMRKTSESVHCSGALSQGGPAEKLITPVINKVKIGRKRQLRFNMGWDPLHSKRVDAGFRKRVVTVRHQI
jgi:hypothetical protein